MLNKLKNSNKNLKKRVGRGDSSGLGRTCGRGEKGQKSRSGSTIRPHFEGGQMPLFRRLPNAKGFKSRNHKEFILINISDLEKNFSTNETVDLITILKKRIVNRINLDVKILGHGNLSKSLKVRAHAFSKSAQEKIIKAGGECIIIK